MEFDALNLSSEHTVIAILELVQERLTAIRFLKIRLVWAQGVDLNADTFPVLLRFAERLRQRVTRGGVSVRVEVEVTPEQLQLLRVLPTSLLLGLGSTFRVASPSLEWIADDDTLSMIWDLSEAGVTVIPEVNVCPSSEGDYEQLAARVLAANQQAGLEFKVDVLNDDFEPDAVSPTLFANAVLAGLERAGVSSRLNSFFDAVLVRAASGPRLFADQSSTSCQIFVSASSRVYPRRVSSESDSSPPRLSSDYESLRRFLNSSTLEFASLDDPPSTLPPCDRGCELRHFCGTFRTSDWDGLRDAGPIVRAWFAEFQCALRTSIISGLVRELIEDNVPAFVDSSYVPMRLKYEDNTISYSPRDQP